LLQAQIGECKRIITQLAAQAGTSRAEAVSRMTLDAWLDQLLQRWRVQRPMVSPEVTLAGPRPGPLVAMDATLGQALLNLFNNAADASPDKVQIQAQWHQTQAFELRVLDRGRGMTSAMMNSLGRDSVSTREDGMGIGVVLAHVAIERSGGRLSFQAREGGGTIAHVQLPLAI
jgi:two-component system sensor histidine kinase RegB